MHMRKTLGKLIGIFKVVVADAQPTHMVEGLQELLQEQRAGGVWEPEDGGSMR
jgi:hypothetical protein